MPSVLIVDHEAGEQRSLALALGVTGFRVATASSESAVFAELEQHGPFDVVLVDLMIPGLNGLNLARALRQTHPHARVILTSAYPLSQRQLERANCGATGFIPKPYEVDEVAQYVKRKVATIAA